MFVWTIEKCENCSYLLKEFLANGVTHEKLKVLQKIIKSIQAHSAAKRLFENIVSRNFTSDSKASRESLLEMTAGLDYVNRNKNAGKLYNILKKCNKSNTKPALAFLKAWYDNASKYELWKTQDFWFKTRVMCMDLYTILRMFSVPRKSHCIFYGGNSHADTMVKVLKKFKAQMIEPSNDMKKLCSNQNLLRLEAYFLKDRIFTIIGENHGRTNINFSDSLLTYLRKECNKTQKIYCLVEKHISNKKDPIQSQLMCNMPYMAIHKFRCDSFTEKNDCLNLKIIPVDNRHYDMGFLRMEIFNLWYESDTFKKCAIDFQLETMSSLQRLILKMEELQKS